MIGEIDVLEICHLMVGTSYARYPERRHEKQLVYGRFRAFESSSAVYFDTDNFNWPLYLAGQLYLEAGISQSGLRDWDNVACLNGYF